MIAQGFVSAGANVYLTSRDPKACQSAAETILGQTKCGSQRDLVGDVHHGPSNVSSREGCKALAEEVSKVFGGRLHVLVNNAGTSWGENPERESGRANWGWDKVLDLNVKGMFYLTRECTDMLSAGEGESSLPFRCMLFCCLISYRLTLYALYSSRRRRRPWSYHQHWQRGWTGPTRSTHSCLRREQGGGPSFDEEDGGRFSAKRNYRQLLGSRIRSVENE